MNLTCNMYAKNLLESSIFSFFFMTALFISKLYFETLSSFVTSLENFLIKRNKQSAFAFSWILFLGWIEMIAIKLLRTKWIDKKGKMDKMDEFWKQTCSQDSSEQFFHRDHQSLFSLTTNSNALIWSNM